MLLLLQAASPPADLFERGQTLLAEGDTLGAVAVWNAARPDGLASAEVEYNLGTLALRRGETGRARLHLERAARLAPLDEDIARNVSLARERSGAPAPSTMHRTVIWMRAVVGSLGLVVLALAAAFGTLGLAVASRQRAALGVGAVAVALVAMASWAVWEASAPRSVVLVEEVAVVESPSPTAAPVARAREGEVVWAGEAEDGWRPVRVGRARGWVREAAVEPVGG
ncbi:MAG: hypothetical protein AAGK21_01740 [Bacteroidota bacterium]